MSDSQADYSRVTYATMRNETGCPAVHRTKLSEDFSVFTVGDMEFEINTHSYGNIWEAKTDCVLMWSQKQKEE